MLWEPRGLYCRPVCEPDEIIDRWMHDRQRYGTAQSILQAWSEAGYTHVLFNRSGAEFVQGEDLRYRPEDWQALEALLAQLALLEDFGGAYSLYRLPP
jgi:hypothetical protein